jgi:hypothetical protein
VFQSGVFFSLPEGRQDHKSFTIRGFANHLNVEDCLMYSGM